MFTALATNVCKVTYIRKATDPFWTVAASDEFTVLLDEYFQGRPSTSDSGVPGRRLNIPQNSVLLLLAPIRVSSLSFVEGWAFMCAAECRVWIDDCM
jgi:hypothetical protein